MAAHIAFKCISVVCIQWLIVDLYATMRFIRNAIGSAVIAAVAARTKKMHDKFYKQKLNSK